MRYPYLLSLLLIGCVLTQPLFAQRFGGNPGSIKWKQIDGKFTRLIFPTGIESEAQRTFSIMEKMGQEMPASLGRDFRKIPVVLQTQPVISNAYVGLAPWRSEFFLRPPQNALFLGSTGWLDNLAIHEYRHVHQFGNFRKGLAKWAYLFAGEEGQALANAAAIPDWFFEGDAVYTETKLLSQGRGRLPFFYDPFHAIWKADKRYSFQKLRSGSLKDVVPNHYLLGYMLVAYGYETYGEDFWKKVTEEAAAFKGLVYPLQRAIKKHTGIGYAEFVDRALAAYKKGMPQGDQLEVPLRNGFVQDKEVAVNESGSKEVQPLSKSSPVPGSRVELSSSPETQLIPSNERTVVNHQFPVWLGEDSLLVLRKPYNQLPHWMLYVQGQATRLGVKDIGIDDYFTYKNRYILYTGYSPDARWNWREFSDIRMFHIDAQVNIRLTKGKRYFSPDLSHGGDKVVAVHISGGGGAEIHLLGTADGALLRSYVHPEGLHFSYPVFDAGDAAVYVAARKVNGENTILQLDLASGSFTPLFPFVNAPIAYLRFSNGNLLFSITQGNQNALWKHDLSSGKMHELAVAETGAYTGDLHPQSGKLVYTRPTAEGEQVFVRDARLSSSEVTGIVPINAAKDGAAFNHSVVFESEQSNIKHLDSVQEGVNPAAVDSAVDSLSQTVPVSDYKSSSRLINIHSWRPFYEQPVWSFSLYGQNVLNTLQSIYNYAYNENEGSHSVGAGLAYGALYPWITAGTKYTINRTYQDSIRLINWNEWSGNIGLRLPLNFTSGKMYRQLDLSSRLHGVSLQYDPKSKPLPFDRFVGYLQNQINWSMQTQQAVQHFHPRFGITARVNSRFAIGNTSANQVLMGTQVYFPGIGRNHSFVVAAHYQRRDTVGQYIFSNNFPMARGYPALDFPRMWRMSYNYHLPLVYPDLGIGNIVYFQRIRANVFFDNMNVKSLRTGRVTNLRTVGTELFFDTKWWNQQPVTFGVRYSRLLDANIFLVRPNANQWEFIMPINLIPNQ